jgi:tetratricopeptide (TPR) repeat protein
MGVVYVAHDPELDRRIALKLLRGGRDDAARSRLLREARAMARLTHPNVVTIHDVGSHDGAVFIAMEFVEGRTLREWLQQTPRPGWDVVLRVFVGAAQGLVAAHAEGIVHRDFKPDNVMVGDDLRVRVMDFGLAGDVERANVEADSTQPELGGSGRSLGAVDLTRTGAVMGTPAYMAPEQHLGQRADERTDQFAYFVALYEALNGERPFPGDTLPVLAFNVVQGKMRGDWHGSVPAWLRDLVRRGLEVEPSSRWPSMTAVLGEITLDRTTRRGRRRALLAGVAAVGLAGALGAQLSTTTPKCESAAATISGVWNEQAAARLRTGFAAVEMPFSADSADRVVDHLSRWTGRWTGAHTRTCQATHVSGTQSSTALDLRMACLEDQRREAGELIGILAAADAALVQDAVQAVSRLPDPEGCETVLGGAEAPPAGLRDDVDEARRSLARIRGLRSAGRLADGLELARTTLSAAEALGWEPLLIESSLHLGMLASDRGEFDEAQRALERAYAQGIARAEDSMASRAALELVYVSGTGRGEHTAALRWSEHARALQRRHGDDSGLAAWHAKRAPVLTAAGRTDDALRELEAAAAATDEARHPVTAFDIANAIGNAHAAAGAFDEALAAYRRGIAVASETFGPGHPSVAIAEFNIGTIYERRGALDRADEAYRVGGERFAEIFGPDNAKVGDAALNRGNVAQSRGRPEEAAAHYATALEVYERALDPEHPRLADLLGVMANLAADQGELERSFALQERAISIYMRAHGSEHPDVGLARFNRAWVMLDHGREREAEAEFADLVRIFDASLPDGHPYRAFFHGGLGDALSARGALAEAAPHYRAALAGEGLPPPDRASVEFSLAKALASTGASGEARAVATEALERYRGLGGAGGEQGAREVEAWLAEGVL